MTNKTILLIAGSDSSGGAGLEADQKVIAAHGCYAMTATTALTAQNTMGVDGIYQVPPEFTRKQIDTVFRDISPSVVKTGMLGSAATIEMLAKALVDHKVEKLVLDPVMVATTGTQLLPEKSVSALRSLLLPKTFILTPNIPEARLLLMNDNGDGGEEVGDVQRVEDLEDLARRLWALGPKYVLVKGGHVPFRKNGVAATAPDQCEMVVDVLLGPTADQVRRIESPFVHSANTHGTGCSLASAIAANLSMGLEVGEAVFRGCRFVEAGIRTARVDLGRGRGPINHFHSTFMLPFAPGRFVEWLLSRPDVAPVWHRFVNHPFVLALGNGELPLESFKKYLVQDYLYLVHFARANALAAYKSKSMEDIAAASTIITHIKTEMGLHVEYCKTFGIEKSEMEGTEEHQACTAYTRYVLDVGQSEDWLGLQIALAPCLLGYGAVAKMLHGDSRTKTEGNTYWPWILNYVADDYVKAVETGCELIERNAVLQSPSRIEELVKIFIHGTKMEIGFWEMFPCS